MVSTRSRQFRMLAGTAIFGLAFAGAAESWAAAPLCWTTKELTAEATVRTGIGMRETVRQCSQQNAPSGAEALAAWGAFEQKVSTQMGSAVKARAVALKRLFPAVPNIEQQWNDGLIASFAGRRLTEGDCDATAKVVKALQKSGWSAFKKKIDLQQSQLQPQVATCTAGATGR